MSKTPNIGSNSGSSATQRPPLVTFALFAFNQEKYVREAVEAALAQTYEPLEVILSDDCSTDRTFNIMQEMAAAYQGPHKVVLRRNEVNYGTALHVQAVADASSGSLLIAAAGDDISDITRTSKIVDCWLIHDSINVSCIHSGAIFFNQDDVNQALFVNPREKSIMNISNRIIFLRKDKLPFFSPTCAYSMNLFKDFDKIMGGSIIEDGVLALRALGSGAVLAIDEPLVRIRQLPETSGTGYNIKNPKRWNKFIMSRLISYSNRLRDISSLNFPIKYSVELEVLQIQNINRLSRFLIGPSQSCGVYFRIWFLIRYALTYPTSAKFLNRVADGVAITGFSRPSIGSFQNLWRREKKEK